MLCITAAKCCIWDLSQSLRKIDSFQTRICCKCSVSKSCYCIRQDNACKIIILKCCCSNFSKFRWECYFFQSICLECEGSHFLQSNRKIYCIKSFCCRCKKSVAASFRICDCSHIRTFTGKIRDNQIFICCSFCNT